MQTSVISTLTCQHAEQNIFRRKTRRDLKLSALIARFRTAVIKLYLLRVEMIITVQVLGAQVIWMNGHKFFALPKNISQAEVSLDRQRQAA